MFKEEIFIADIKRMENKLWFNNDNKLMLKMLKEKKINIAPSSLKGLDSCGLNHIEILTVIECLDINYLQTSVATSESLELIERKYNIKFSINKVKGNCKYKMFGYERFQDGKPISSHSLHSLKIYEKKGC